ncbi:hypothetical protein [Sorangium cellulosum]|uniref:PIN domain-containing protein n=2 Tax=Sorangium cellulosum TaxID=56 RepID=S4Y0D0_SORCE|nr:hypothetical protein [Sorangium cellulosum]AGP37620.1 hypothetical protein SCE1572_25940 [Sorangium cellulosum So0157-2]
MTKKRAAAIVVDTSVARSCGKQGAADLHALACLDALIALRESGLMLAMSPALLAEWERHWSTFARRWFYKMRSSRRVRDVAPGQHGPTRKAARALLDTDARQAVAKDMLLVEAALASDRRVISLDEKVRRHFAVLAASVADLRSVHWANPTSTGCIAWLAAQAPDDPVWKLGTPR